jgi:hypothetical protein
VRFIGKIMANARHLIIQQKDASLSDEEAMQAMNTFLNICGLIDAAFTSLSVLDRTEEEMADAEAKVNKCVHVWREKGLSMTLKVHILEHH